MKAASFLKNGKTVLLGWLAFATTPAFADQAIDPTTLPPTQALDAPAAERLFGDWGGLQNELVENGVGLKIDALSELAGNTSGGTRQGATFANQVGVNLDINWERLSGITGLSSHVIMVNRSGSSDSRVFGDNLAPVQEIYGSGGDVAVHLVSAYLQETFKDKLFDIAAGRMNVENDFASSPLYCNFMNNDLCGDPKALPGGDVGHSAYPDAAWALRLIARPIADFELATGVYEVNQGLYTDQYFRTGFDWLRSKDSGVYLPLQVTWAPKFGDAGLLGHYKLGLGFDNSDTYKPFTDALAMSGVPGFRSTVHSGNTQYWALADQMLLRNGKDDDAGLIALGGVIVNDPDNTQYADQYFAGLTDRGFLPGRPRDAISVLFTYIGVSDRLAHVEAIEQHLGLPLTNSATGVQSHEILLEAMYQIKIIDGISVQPDFQYIIRPNGQANIKDATVFGCRLYADL